MAEGYVQDKSLGIFRSDYMLRTSSNHGELTLGQVEFNTFSVAGGCHSNKVSDMHKYLMETGAYGKDGTGAGSSFPPNTTIKSIAEGLAEAHVAYGGARSGQTSMLAVLFVVQPNNINVCDERPIEHALISMAVPSYRVEFGDEHFISHEDAMRVAKTTVPLYPLDESELGQKARTLATNPESAAKHVLKPSLEGGGHNIYRKAIPAFLKSQPVTSWHENILMEMMESPTVHNILLSHLGFYSGPAISELGIFGVCLWRQGPKSVEVIRNRQAGFSFKTKRRDMDEMSVVKGYGCFDNPCLI
ncbi:MAG: hypothetical protein Q9163_000105 [Psora crenata]